MGGVNPYIAPASVKPPEKKYTITFLPSGKMVEVDPAKIPYGRNGLEGSILDIALGSGLDVDHACGGVCACSTCHVIVERGLESCNESTEAEEDMLDNARGLTAFSRLACQTVPDGTRDVVVRIPDWNRNLAKEG